MRTPRWWNSQGMMSQTLLPLATLYYRVSRARKSFIKTGYSKIPVACVGNVVAGGAGKTPVAIALMELLRDRYKNPMFLTRGYGGICKEITLVDSSEHTAAEVGDEALLLARVAPVIIARDRLAGAHFAEALGADLLVMDDGFQNPSLHKNLSLLVIDAEYGVGNGALIPAGPLREPLEGALKRADGVVLVHPPGVSASALKLPEGVRVFVASIVAKPLPNLPEGARVLGFAGIARPEKFFATLRQLKLKVAGVAAFGDHQRYTPPIFARLRARAQHTEATLVTTRKDWVRLPETLRTGVEVVDIEAQFADTEVLRAFCLEKLA